MSEENKNPDQPATVADIAKLLCGVKADLSKSISDQATNLESSFKHTIDTVVGPVIKRQEDYEEKNDGRLKQLEDQVASLADLVKEGNAAAKHFPPLAFPQQPLPPANTARAPLSAPVPAASEASQVPSGPIQDLIKSARCVIGIGPIKQSYYDKFGDVEPSEAVRLVAIEALRIDLNIKEHEINENDIANTFLPKREPKIPRVYIRFHKQEHADLCLKVAKSLLNSQAKVFRYFPRQFQDRVWALEDVAYPMRRKTFPPFKTDVVYTDSDVQLLICPQGQFRYYPHYVPNLPPIDMTPLRSPPKGRGQTKRDRSSDSNPAQDERKSSRIHSPPKSPAKSSEANARDEELDYSSQNDSEHTANIEVTDIPNQEVTDPEAAFSPPDPAKKSPPKPQFSKDLGGYTNIQALSPSTGKVTFNFKQPVNLRRASLNF